MKLEEMCGVFFPSHAQLVVMVDATGKTMTITSPRSEPFIICTHTLQWKQSEQSILKKLAFGDSGTSVSWDTFRDMLAAHFTAATGTRQRVFIERLTIGRGVIRSPITD